MGGEPSVPRCRNPTGSLGPFADAGRGSDAKVTLRLDSDLCLAAFVGLSRIAPASRVSGIDPGSGDENVLDTGNNVGDGIG